MQWALSFDEAKQFPFGPVCVWPADYTGNCTNVGPECDCLPWQVSSFLHHPLVGRPASTASAPHSAQRTNIAPMATHVMTAAGALKWRTRDVTATAPTVRASMQCVICLVMKTASTVMARIVSQASHSKNL